MLIDTHCHIHDSDYPGALAAYERARAAGVEKMICIGTSEENSIRAVEFSRQFNDVYAVVGVHPHDTQAGVSQIASLLQQQKTFIVGIGEIGLDYFYTHSPKDVQVRALEQQLQWAHDYALPVSFHVREAFDDFWPIFDNFHGIKGVLHSFTDTRKQLEQGLTRGLYVGVNGISTFTKDSAQKEMFRSIPLDRLVLETDAPFLTPAPKRGTVNEPAFVRYVADFHATDRGVELKTIARQTSANATALFTL